MPYAIKHALDTAGVQFEPAIDRKLFAQVNMYQSLPESDFARIPSQAVVTRFDTKPLAAILGWSIGPFLVNERVRDLMEGFNPKTFRFVPVELVDKLENGSTSYIETYFLLANIPDIDAVVVEETDFRNGAGFDGYSSSVTFSHHNNAKISLDPEIVGDLCLWKLSPQFGYKEESNRSIRSHFCSDALWEALKTENLYGWTSEYNCVWSRKIK